MLNKNFFFTKKWKKFSKTKGPYYPTVGLHSGGEIIQVNFGQKPFKFDLESMVIEEKERILNSVNKMPIQIGDQNDIIRSYLLHYGYLDTLMAFGKALGENNNSTTNGVTNSPQYNAYIF